MTMTMTMIDEGDDDGEEEEEEVVVVVEEESACGVARGSLGSPATWTRSLSSGCSPKYSFATSTTTGSISTQSTCGHFIVG